jgi:hypothetical protein
LFNGPEIPMSIFFLSMAAIFVLRGPFGRALAERISGRAARDDGELEELRSAVADLRHELGEVQERLDFAERLLARQSGAERLAPPR